MGIRANFDVPVTVEAGTYDIGDAVGLPQYDSESGSATLIVAAHGLFIVARNWDEEGGENGGGRITISAFQLLPRQEPKGIEGRAFDEADYDDDYPAMEAAADEYERDLIEGLEAARS